MIRALTAAVKRLRTAVVVMRAGKVLRVGNDLHVGRNFRAWAPDEVRIGNGVYIGKDVSIECNAEIGDYCLIANRVGFVGRHDHDFSVVGTPVRFSPWIGSGNSVSKFRNERVSVEQDVWIGYGVILVTGVRVGRGSIIAAGAVVTKDIPPYSIAAGVPARPIGQRFESADDIARHEAMVRTGKFRSSEKGFDYFTIEPGET